MNANRRTRPILIGLAALAAFTGCTLDAAPTPSPTDVAESTARATATPEPSDPLESVTGLVIGPDSLRLLDEVGTTVGELDYLSDPGVAVETLAIVFGTAPVDEEYDGSNHQPPSTAHRWDAFALWEQRYVDRWEGVVEVSLAQPNFMAEFTGPEALVVDLATSDRRHVGDAWSDLMAAPGIMTNPSECSGPYLEFVELHREDPDGTPSVLKVSVEFRSSQDESRVERISAPVPVFEDGCA